MRKNISHAEFSADIVKTAALKDYLRLLRPTHWVKNIFVFVPIIFSLKLPNMPAIIGNMLAFAAFCGAASAIYVFNDIHDAESDRRHPVKKNRPIASGAIGKARAWGIFFAAACSSVSLAFLVNPYVGVVTVSYLAMNIFYGLKLKEMVILDVMTIAAGFIMRILAGSAAIDVYMSHWLLLTTFFISLFIGFAKRRHEMTSLGERADGHRKVLSMYNVRFADEMITTTAGMAIVFYSLYTIDSAVVSRLGTSSLVYTVPVVVYGLFRYMYLVYVKTEGGDPVDVVLKDAGIISSVAIWFIMVIAFIYFRI